MRKQGQRGSRQAHVHVGRRPGLTSARPPEDDRGGEGPGGEASLTQADASLYF